MTVVHTPVQALTPFIVFVHNLSALLHCNWGLLGWLTSSSALPDAAVLVTARRVRLQDQCGEVVQQGTVANILRYLSKVQQMSAGMAAMCDRARHSWMQ